MAGVSKMDMCKAGGMMVAMLMVLMAAAMVGAQPGTKLKDIYRITSEENVYPYWSLCDAPAELGASYNYGATHGLSGMLEPEYDETNATYYVRLSASSDSGATYVAAMDSTDSGTLLVNSTVYIVNSESRRVLAWRQEGTDEYFLIEQEASSNSEGAPFRFLLADDVPLVCPRILTAQCHAYYLVSDPSGVGLQTYQEDSVTYIKAAAKGSTGNLPILVFRVGSTTTTIRSVTARDH